MYDTKDEDLTLYNRLFDEQEKYENQWKKNQRLYNSEFTKKQFKELKKKKRSKIFIPITRNTVNIIKAIFSTAFFSRGNPIEILPRTDDEEKELVVYRNKVIDYYYDKLKPSKELIKAFGSALVFGMGIVTTYWDDNRKKVITRFVPITDIAFDYECSSIDDIETIGYKSYETARTTQEKIKSGFYNQKNLKKLLFKNEKPKSYDRYEVKTIYIRKSKGWRSKTFIMDVLVRDTLFKNMPFQFGHAISKMPDIDETVRKDEILCYGDTVPNYLESLQNEINHKRNLKNDIQEKILNPDVYVGDMAKVNPSELNYGAGMRIRVNGDVNQIKERAVPNEYALNNDLGMLAGDVQSAVGVNSIQEGKTGASDRRSANAMSVINSNSSMRIEEMIILLKETLFEHWAKTWVDIVMKNADDDVINRITNKEYPLGMKGDRDDIKYDLKINFGMTLDKQQKINDKLQVYQMTAQNPNINPKIVEGVLKDVLVAIVGDDTELTELFKEPQQEPQQNPQQQEPQQQEPTPDDIEKRRLLNGGI